jgi:hypothetical protein
MHTSIPTSQSLQKVPVYWVSDIRQEGTPRSVPVVVSLLFVMAQGALQITPAAQRSIDKTVEVTNRQGLVTALFTDANKQPETTVDRWLQRAFAMPDVIVLLSCQSANGARRLMAHLQRHYVLSLVREEAQ